jgi:hypothetical protein
MIGNLLVTWKEPSKRIRATMPRAHKELETVPAPSTRVKLLVYQSREME